MEPVTLPTRRFVSRLYGKASEVVHDRYALALFGILLIALVLRLYRLDTDPQGLYYDEVTSTYVPFDMVRSGLDISQLASMLVSVVTGPFPVYFLVGPSVFFTRLPSVLYGTALVVPMYLLGTRLGDRNLGLVAAGVAAVVPWGVEFSRYGIISSAYAFYVAAYAYFLVAYCQTKRPLYRYAFAGALVASLYTHIMALPFGLLFLATALPSLHLAKLLPRRRDLLAFPAVFVLGALPYVAVLLAPAQTSPAFAGFTAFRASKGLGDLVGSWVDSFWIHLSPDFLVFTAGQRLMLPMTLGYTHRAGNVLVYYYGGGGATGMLDLYGILVYPGLALVAAAFLRRKAGLREILLGTWIFSYALASGYAYYDNPNAARNIAGLGGFILLIAWTLWTAARLLLERLPRRLRGAPGHRRALGNVLVVVGAVVLVVAPAAQFLDGYYGTYPAQSAPYFDYEYQALAGYLTAHDLWSKGIYIYDDMKWYGYVDLSYYNDSARNHIAQIEILTELQGIAPNGEHLVVLRTEDAFRVTLGLGVPLVRLATLNYPDGSLGIILSSL